MSKHHFKDDVWKYIDKGISVIPDSYGKKAAAIKGWTDYGEKFPTTAEIKQWIDFLEPKGSNIAVMTGEKSKIICLDIDTTDQKLLDILEPLIPPTPVIKIGAKGKTYFYKFDGESNYSFKYNGDMIYELLSTGKKTTVFPSLHPNGSSYAWESDSILDIELDALPFFPRVWFAHVESAIRGSIPDLTKDGTFKVKSGRNDELSSLCGTLINKQLSLDEAVEELIKFDKENHDIPLFSDLEVFPHAEPSTNAGVFYLNHLNTVNSRRFRKNEEYQIPMLASAINLEVANQLHLGKSQKAEKLKNESCPLPTAQNALSYLIQNVLDNSYVPQVNFAMSSALITASTLIGRKVIYNNAAPNLYILNIAESGRGKDAPQKQSQIYLNNVSAADLIGSADYVSDASITQTLQDTGGTRLDIIDECSGLLRNINKGGNGYDGKMADIYCELYTSSTSVYTGRATAEGKKGACIRPNVNLLCSTTPSGFSEGVSTVAIDKGLIGRFSIFRGTSEDKPRRLTAPVPLDPRAKKVLRFWQQFKPPESDYVIGQQNQEVVFLKESPEAKALSDKYFDELVDESEKLRKIDPSNSILPVMFRMYQKMSKFVMIHACMRAGKVPTVEAEDVEFGYKLIKFVFETEKEMLTKYIHSNKNEYQVMKVLNIIRDCKEGIPKSLLWNKTKALTKRERDTIIKDLIENEQIVEIKAKHYGKFINIYKGL